MRLSASRDSAKRTQMAGNAPIRKNVRHSKVCRPNVGRLLCFICIWNEHLTAIVRVSKKGKCEKCHESGQIVRV